MTAAPDTDAPGDHGTVVAIQAAIEAARVNPTVGIGALRRLTAGTEDSTTRIALLRALADAELAVGSVERAIRCSLEASDLARALPDRALVQRLLVRHSGLLVRSGDPSAAIDMIEAVLAEAPPDEVKVDALAQRALILHRLDRDLEAIAAYTEALVLAAAMGRENAVAQMANNRGLLHASRLDLAEAEADLRRSLSTYRTLDDHVSAAVAEHNLGLVLGRQGRVEEGLVRMTAAASAFAALGVHQADVASDRAELYLQARLLVEARDELNRAISIALRADERRSVPDMHMVLARIQASLGDLPAAIDAAREARQGFDGQQRGPSRRQALAVVQMLTGEQPHAEADQLDRSVLIETALAVHRHLDPGDGRASALLDFAADERGSANQVTRIQAWWAAGRRSLDHGAADDAASAVTTTIEELAVHAVTISSLELRALAMSDIAPVEELATETALRLRSPAAFRSWASSLRAIATPAVVARSSTATSLPVPGAHRPDSAADSFTTTTPGRPDDLAALMADLRSTADAVNRADTTSPDLADLLRRRSELEWRVRSASWTAGTAALRDQRPIGGISAVSPHEGRVTVTYGRTSTTLVALVSDGGVLELVEMGALADIAMELSAVRYASTQLSSMFSAGDGRSTPLHPGRVRARLDSLDRSARRLQALVLPQLPGGGPVMVLPNATVAGVPWLMLPALRQRGTTFGLTDARRPADSGRRHLGRVAVVAGPGLDHAEREARVIAELYHDPIVLTGDAARSGAVLEAMADVDVVHVAAHGSFRRDLTYLSAVELADGPMSLYDLEGLRRSPATVILSCCDLGSSGATRTGAIGGLAGTLLARGTEELIAAVVPISDTASADMMRTFHLGLLAGVPADEALRATAHDDASGGVHGRDGAGFDDELSSAMMRWTARSFVAMVDGRAVPE